LFVLVAAGVPPAFTTLVLPAETAASTGEVLRLKSCLVQITTRLRHEASAWQANAHEWIHMFTEKEKRTTDNADDANVLRMTNQK